MAAENDSQQTPEELARIVQEASSAAVPPRQPITGGLITGEADRIRELEGLLRSEVDRREQAETELAGARRALDLSRARLDGREINEAKEQLADDLRHSTSKQDNLRALERSKWVSKLMNERDALLANIDGLQAKRDAALARAEQAEASWQQAQDWHGAVMAERDAALARAREAEARLGRLVATGDLMYDADTVGLGLARRAWQAETGP